MSAPVGLYHHLHQQHHQLKQQLVLGLPASGFQTAEQKLQQVWVSGPSGTSALVKTSARPAKKLQRGKKRRPASCKVVESLRPAKVASPRPSSKAPTSAVAAERKTPHNAPAQITVVPSRTSAMETMTQNLRSGTISASEVGQVMEALGTSGSRGFPWSSGPAQSEAQRTQSAPSRRTAWKASVGAAHSDQRVRSALKCWSGTNQGGSTPTSGLRGSDDGRTSLADLRRPPAMAAARRVLAGKEDALVALPWIHSIAASVRREQVAEDESKRQRHATLKTKLRVGSRVTGKLGMDFTSVQARRAAQEEAARVVKEREERRLKRLHSESQRRMAAAEKRRLRGIFS